MASGLAFIRLSDLSPYGPPYRRELPVSGCAHQWSEGWLELGPLGFGVAVLLLSAARRVDAYTALEDHLDQIESPECRCMV